MRTVLLGIALIIALAVPSIAAGAPLPPAWALAEQISVPLYAADNAPSWLHTARSPEPECTGLWQASVIVTAAHCRAVGVPMAHQPATNVLGWSWVAVGPELQEIAGSFRPVDVQVILLPGTVAPTPARWRTAPLRPRDQVVAMCRAPIGRWFAGVVTGPDGGYVRVRNSLRINIPGCSGAPLLDAGGRIAGMIVAIPNDGRAIDPQGDALVESARIILDALGNRGVNLHLQAGTR